MTLLGDGRVMSWMWIGIAMTVPMVLGLLVSLPFWFRRRNPLTGAILGSGIVFASVLGLVGREYIELSVLNQRCLAAEIACPLSPEAFTRFCIYGFIGMIQVFALYWISLTVEERVRRREFSPEWR